MKKAVWGFIVVMLVSAGMASAQTMTMPDEVYATLSAVVKKYPHAGTDDDRRAAMEKAVQTIRARYGHRWVWKTEHQSLIAPSKDGLGFVAEGDVVHGRLTTMFIWDTISGGSRQPYPPPLVSEAARPAYVLAVEPKDWLAGDPPPPPPVDVLAELRTLIAALDARLTALLTAITELHAQHLELLKRGFPEYAGSVRLFGTNVPITLKPQPR